MRAEARGGGSKGAGLTPNGARGWLTRLAPIWLRFADTDPGDTIPLASVGKEALDKTVEYMEKMAAFKADGTSDEDKLAWVSEYKKTMEAQDQLPLLFQTMTVRHKLFLAQ